MIKIKGKGLRILKSLHLMGIICWIGGMICASGLLVVSKSVPNKESLIYLIDLMTFVDYAFIISGAMTTVFIGIIYGVFTNWGFVKTRWIAVKWILSLIIIVKGIIVYLPTIGNMQELVIQYGLAAMQNHSYQALYQKFLINSLFNVILVVVMLLLSSIRPKLDLNFSINKKSTDEMSNP